MTKFLNNKRNQIIAGVVLAFFTVFLQNMPGIYSYFVKEDIQFTKISRWEFEADISSLKPGHYFLSVGRPRAACDIIWGDRALKNNRSLSPEVRGELLLGTDFIVDENSFYKPESHKIFINCSFGAVNSMNYIFVKSALTHFPVIAPFFEGKILHYWRGFTDCFQGPFFSLLMVFLVLISFRNNSLQSRRLFVRGVCFALISFLYSMSLGLWVGLFANYKAYSVSHIILKNLFILTMMLFFESFAQKKYIYRILITIQFLITLCGVGVAVFYIEHIGEFYRFEYSAFPILIFCMLVGFINKENSTKEIIVIRLALVVAFIVHLIDFYNLFQSNQVYLAPSFVTVLTIMLSYISYRESLLQAVLIQKTNSELIYVKKIKELADHVAHDIRSPLQALRIIEPSFKKLSNEEQEIASSAMTRIREILEGLIHTQEKVTRENLPQNIFELLQELCTEKRVLYKNNINLKINLIPPSEAVSYFSILDTKEFKRVLSNLIDNGVESFEETTLNQEVKITLTQKDKFNSIEITDNGKGIEESVLPLLFKRGATFGKKDGSGLGLHHAKKTIESFNGKIFIISKVNSGTTVRILLPEIFI